MFSDLVGEEGSDAVEKLQLLLQSVTTLLWHIHHIKNRRPQMSQSCDGLHLNGVPLLQGVVQYPWGVHHLLPIKKAECYIITQISMLQMQTIQKEGSYPNVT